MRSRYGAAKPDTAFRHDAPGRGCGSPAKSSPWWVRQPHRPGRARLARSPSRRYSTDLRSLRLAVQDVALSRRKQGFDSPRERQPFQYISGFVAGVVCHLRKFYGKDVPGRCWTSAAKLASMSCSPRRLGERKMYQPAQTALMAGPGFCSTAISSGGWIRWG